jgi:ferric-dicitrate binding protein FerR (iron transport regulator)
VNDSLDCALPEDLVQRYFDGELEGDGERKLAEWLAASPENMSAFVEQLEVHASLWEKSAASAVMPAPGRPIAQPRTGRGRWRLVAALSAACLLLGAGVAYWLLSRPGPQTGSRAIASVERGTLSIQRAGRRLVGKSGDPLFAGDRLSCSSMTDIGLADGSSVKLDRGTDLVLKPTGEGGRANLGLKSGRAFLRVAEAPGEFRVAGSARVRVLGTVFGVEERGGRTEVDVLEGRVELSSAGEAVNLRRGQSAAAAAGKPPAITGADPNVELLWARELIRFENRPLRDVLAWIEANSSYRFEIPEKQLAAHRVSVAVAEEPMREVIEALMLSCGLDYRFEKHDVRVK